MNASDDAPAAVDAAVDEAAVINCDPNPNSQTPNPDRRVPVTEAIRYRKRAQAAEQQLGEVSEKLKATESELERVRQTVASLERRQKIDALLADADAVDLEVARLLTEAAVEVMEQPDVHEAVEELRRSKPYLFHRTHGPRAGAMPARHAQQRTHLTEDAAEAAATTGNRRDLLTYLRLRRSGARAMSS